MSDMRAVGPHIKRRLSAANTTRHDLAIHPRRPYL